MNQQKDNEKVDKKITDWLQEDNNPAVKYRTQTELFGQKADTLQVKQWIECVLPKDWFSTKGLWYIYYVTTLAECGLTKDDIHDTYLQRGVDSIRDNFAYGCADFMLLRALVKLGFQESEWMWDLIGKLESMCLPDGGYLCQKHLKSIRYTPKSCYKANVFALMFLAEYRKKGMDISFGQSIIDYFLKRNIFYRSDDKAAIIMETATKTFHPFEPMRVGIHNLVESFSALGYGNDERLSQAWSYLYANKSENGKMMLSQTLTKSYLPKEKAGQESKWVTLYTMLAQKEQSQY